MGMMQAAAPLLLLLKFPTESPVNSEVAGVN
jgi:hypothetical protein